MEQAHRHNLPANGWSSRSPPSCGDGFWSAGRQHGAVPLLWPAISQHAQRQALRICAKELECRHQAPSFHAVLAHRSAVRTASHALLSRPMPSTAAPPRCRTEGLANCSALMLDAKSVAKWWWTLRWRRRQDPGHWRERAQHRPHSIASRRVSLVIAPRLRFKPRLAFRSLTNVHPAAMLPTSATRERVGSAWLAKIDRGAEPMLIARSLGTAAPQSLTSSGARASYAEQDAAKQALPSWKAARVRLVKAGRPILCCHLLHHRQRGKRSRLAEAPLKRRLPP